MKKLIALILVCVMAFSLCACGNGGNDDADNSTPSGTANYTGPSYTLTLGHVIADGTPTDEGADKFAQLVDEASGGKIKIEVYPNSALGDNRAMIESVQQGTIDMVLPAVANLAAFTSSTKLFDMPFLFTSDEHAEAVLDGEVGTQILNELESAGLVGLAWWLQGWRELTTDNVAFHKAGDLGGAKIRVQDNEIHIATWKALGGSPTTLAYSELFTALQQGTIACQENPLSNIKLSGFSEVQNYVIMTNHIYDPIPVVMSKKTWDSLDPAAQDIIKKAAIEAGEWERDFAADYDAKLLKEWEPEDNGPTVIILTDAEKAALREAVQPVYDQYESIVGADLLAKVEAAAPTA